MWGGTAPSGGGAPSSLGEKAVMLQYPSLLEAARVAPSQDHARSVMGAGCSAASTATACMPWDHTQDTAQPADTCVCLHALGPTRLRRRSASGHATRTSS